VLPAGYKLNLYTYIRVEQMLDTRSPKQVNFVWWHVLFVGPQYGCSSCHPSGTWNFEVAARHLVNLCTPDIYT
jgi:hypothetical protein